MNPYGIGHLITTLVPGDFVRDGICAQTDPDIFFPEKGGSPAPAKLVCMRCPVRMACAEHAITADTNPLGILGATTYLERRRIRQERGIRNQHPETLVDKCGTEAGAKRHWRAGETACTACLNGVRQAKAGRRT